MTDFSFDEVVNHLHITPYTLRHWSQYFSRFLGDSVNSDQPRYSNADIATLITVQTLLEQGFDIQQVAQRLMPKRTPAQPEQVATQATPQPATQVATQPTVEQQLPQVMASTKPVEQNALAPRTDSLAMTPEQPPVDVNLPQGTNELLATISSSQQAVLNNQYTVRELVSVVVQDNFNLKEENRKLRERMVELERVFSEYQRREETRKERLESRLRALEGTVSALQQQVAQFSQLFRRKPRSRGWFG